EQYRELAPFPRLRSSVEPLTWWLLFYSFAHFPGSRFLLWHTACPDQHFTPFIRCHLLPVDQLFCERGQLFLVELELELQRAVGQPAPLLEEGRDAVNHLIEVHQGSSSSCSNNALASCKSLVSNPSVNQL